jgi:membrane protein YqaA with SNARE-associated domain
MKATSEKLYKWASLKATSSKSPLWIGLLFLCEIALFIPLDAVLMFFCLQNPRKTLLYVTIAAAASTLSGVIGYAVGHYLWDFLGSYIVPNLIPAATFAHIANQFHHYDHWAVFFGTLIPFPLKVLSLGAGVFKLGLPTFMCYMLFARLLRFSLIGASMLIWGNKVKILLDQHFPKVLLVIAVKTLLIFLIFWYAAR